MYTKKWFEEGTVLHWLGWLGGGIKTNVSAGKGKWRRMSWVEAWGRTGRGWDDPSRNSLRSFYLS
jgi:hypothetical protein